MRWNANYWSAARGYARNFILLPGSREDKPFLCTFQPGAVARSGVRDERRQSLTTLSRLPYVVTAASRRRHTINCTAAILLLLTIGCFTAPATSYAATPPEEIWKSLKRLPPAEREKKLIDGAKNEGVMIWYTNSGLENATRYVQAFK